MLKKTMALLLAWLLAVSLCACGTQGKTFVAGTVSGNHYESAFAGVSCDLGSDWTFMTDEQLREYNAQTQQIFGDDYAAALANATVITDMFATHTNQMDTVNVTFKKLIDTGTALTEEAYAQTSGSSVAEGLTATGFENVTYETGKIPFAGGEHSAIFVTGTFAGIAMYETLALVKCEGYMMIVTVCTWYENTTQSVLANFT